MAVYGMFVGPWMCGTAYYIIICFIYIYGSSGTLLCVSSDMLLLSVNSNCAFLYVVYSPAPCVAVSLWQFCYWYEIPINTLSFSFYNNSFPSNAFQLLFFLFALYASFKRCLCHSINVTKYTKDQYFLVEI